MDWMEYHIGEELLIASICFALGVRALRIHLGRGRAASPKPGPDVNDRIYLASAGFFLLSINSVLHSMIHIFGLSSNLLFHTLFGYSLGLLLIISSISLRNPAGKRYLPAVLYVPFIAILLPWVHPLLPPFTEFRPLMWVLVAYLSGTLVILCIALYRNTKARPYLSMGAGFLLIAISGVFLFFPSSIGSTPWLHGHLMRPLGFIILLFSVRENALINLKGSILYRAIVAFSLLAAIPLLFFGIAVFYEEINPLGLVERRFLIFVLILSTLIAALIFGIGTVIRLMRPILELKKGVGALSGEGFDKEIRIKTGDEIEDLAGAFNRMVDDLKGSIREQERLGRLAAMGEMSARLAHEIRNPLNAIAGAASYIRKNFKGKLIDEFLSIIREEANRINVLTTSLLNFSKPISPRPSLSDINESVKETVGLISREYSDKEVLIETELDNGVPRAMFDRDQIKQVLINLLLNALDASEGGQTVRITTSRSDDSIVLSVADRGRGIGKEDLESIFRPFYTTKTKGTGLGLPIAERIVKEHGGEIKVGDNEGGGSIFSMRLPIRT